MADISAELQAILDATYGEEVRGSIHDAIEKINIVNENSATDIENAERTINTIVNTIRNEYMERVVLWERADAYETFFKTDDYVTLPRSLRDFDKIEILFNKNRVVDVELYNNGFDISELTKRDSDYIDFVMADFYYFDDTKKLTIHQNRTIRVAPPSTITEYPPTKGTSSYGVWVERITGFKKAEQADPIIVSGEGEKSIIENDLENSTASGNYSHAEGEYSTASGIASHAEGYNAKAIGDYSHAEGRITKASGKSSHAEGDASKAYGPYSHAEGSWATASGECAHAEGHHTTATGKYQHVSGVFNIEDTEEKYAEIIGNGESDLNRSNARTLDWDGNEWLAGYLELGPNRARLTPEAISHMDGVVSTIKSMLTTETVNGNPIILDDAAENMEPVELEVGLLYTKDESTGAITGYTSGSVTVNSDVITTNFPQEAGLVCGGKYDPVNGTLTVTKIGVQAAWEDMIFSIDPDNYLGKRIALTDCFGGLAGAEISDCHVLSGGTNLSPDYIYDQSAATHFYVYNDNIDSYAVVVLPDTTPSDAVITVVGTLKNPITYEVTASEILLALEDNTISSNMNAPMKLTYYHDAIRQEQADIQNAKPIFSDPNNDGNIVIYFADEV